MLDFIDALGSYFQTSVGQYWAYMYVGLGILIGFLIIFDNLKK